MTSSFLRHVRQVATFIALAIASRFYSFDFNGTLQMNNESKGVKTAVVVTTNDTTHQTTPKRRPCYIIAENKADYQ